MKLDYRYPAIVRDDASGNALGYSLMARNLEKALLKIGVELTPTAPIGIYVGPPHLFAPMEHKPWLVLSMWEAWPIPPDIIAYLHQADGLIVPSDYCATLFRKTGYRQPIIKMPLGIWEDDWPTAPRVRRHGQPLRFLWLNARAERKGWPYLGPAWALAFQDEIAMSLTIKTSPDAHERPMQDFYHPGMRVHTIARRLPWEELRDLYCTHHVFLNTSTCEGFGLTSLEAMACGLLVISPRHTGLAEYIHRGVAWLVETERVWMRYENGIRARVQAPKVHHLAALMRRAVVDFEATEEMRVAAMAHAKTFTWEASARTLVAALSRAQVA